MTLGEDYLAELLSWRVFTRRPHMGAEAWASHRLKQGGESVQ